MSGKQGSTCKECVKFASPLAPFPGRLPRMGHAFQLLCIHRMPGRVSLEYCLGSAEQAGCFRFPPGCSKQASVALQRGREIGMDRCELLLLNREGPPIKRLRLLVVPLLEVGISQEAQAFRSLDVIFTERCFSKTQCPRGKCLRVAVPLELQAKTGEVH